MPAFADFVSVIASTPPRIKLTGIGTPDWVFMRWDIDGYTLSVDYNAGMDADEPVLESLCEAYLFATEPEIEGRILGGGDSRVVRKFTDQELDEIEAAMKPFLPTIEPLVVEATPYRCRPEAWGGPKIEDDDIEDDDIEDEPAAEQDQARRLREWAASPREGLPGWSGYDDELLNEEELAPTEAAFLDLIARDINEHPERLIDFPAEMVEQMRSSVEGVEVNLDEGIVGPVALGHDDEELPTDAD